MTDLVRSGSRFFAFEMRRHLPFVGVLLAALLLFERIAVQVAVGHGVSPEGDLERSTLAGVLLGVFALVLGLQLGLGGWSRERRDGSLAWLYGRPMPATLLFAARLAAGAAALALFLAVGCLLLRVSPTALFETVVSGSEAGAWWFLGSVVFLAALVFTSALANAAGIALGMAILLTSLALLLSLGLSSATPAPADLLARPEVVAVARRLLLLVGLPAAFLVGAWVATRRAILDRGQLWRGFGAAAGVAAFAFAAALAAVWVGTHRHDTRELAQVPLGGESALVVRFDPDLSWGLTEMVVERPGDEEALGFAFDSPPFLHGATGRAAVPLLQGEWVVVEGDGRVVQRIDAGHSRTWDAAGWSPDGRWFALACAGPELPPGAGEAAAGACSEPSARSSLLVFGVAGSRLLPLPTGVQVAASGGSVPSWRAAWIDAEHLAVSVASQGDTPGRWSILAFDGKALRVLASRELPPGEALVLPVPAAARSGITPTFGAPEVLRDAPARLGRGLVAWRQGGEGRSLVVVEPASDGDASWRLRSLADLPAASLPWLHFGATPALLAGGRLVWVEGEVRDGRRPVLALDPGAAAPRQVCDLPVRPEPGPFLGLRDPGDGQSSPGESRAEWLPAYSPFLGEPVPPLSCIWNGGA